MEWNMPPPNPSVNDAPTRWSMQQGSTGRRQRELTVLVADGNTAMRHLICDILMRSGDLKALEVASGQEIFDALNCRAVDALIVRVSLPDVDAVALIRTIRRSQNRRHCDMPILVLSSVADYRLVTAIRDAGANVVLAMPLSAHSLLEHMAAAIERPRPFVETATYVGPDRRGRQDVVYRGPERRRSASAAGQSGGDGETGVRSQDARRPLRQGVAVAPSGRDCTAAGGRQIT